MRQAGIICSIEDLETSDLGQGAYRFIDLLAEEKIQVWYINSFYQNEFYLSGNEKFISVDKLCEYGLLNPTVVDDNEYTKEELLKLSFDNFNEFFSEYKKEYKKFLKQAFWLDQYVEHFAPNNEYHRYLQFVFKKQYSDFKQYANDKNIKLMMHTHMIEDEEVLRRYENLADMHIDYDRRIVNLIDFIKDDLVLSVNDIIITSDYFNNMTLNDQLSLLPDNINHVAQSVVASSMKEDNQMNFIHYLMNSHVDLVLVNIYDYTAQKLDEKISFEILNKKRFKLRNIVDSCQRRKQYR